MKKRIAALPLLLLCLASACGEESYQGTYPPESKEGSVSLSDITSEAEIVSSSEKRIDVSSDVTVSSNSSMVSSFPDSGLSCEFSSLEDGLSSNIANSSDPSIDASSSDFSSSSESSEDSKCNCMKRLLTISDLEKADKIFMVGVDGSSYFGYTGKEKDEKTPWYYAGEALSSIDGADILSLGKETVELGVSFADGKIALSLGSSYLWAGYSDYHANIGLKDEPCYFTVTCDGNDGSLQLCSNEKVYVEYYDSKFQGASEKYKDKAKVSFYSYHHVDGIDSSADISSSSDFSSSAYPSESFSYSPSDGSSYWERLDTSKTGNSFRADLQSLIKQYKTRTASYHDCLGLGAKAAAYPLGSSTFVPFYHAAPNVEEGVTSNGATTTSKDLCNREHTWPKSRGSGKSGPGADPFIIRPTLKSENSSRSNYFYGYSSKNEWDPASCGYEYARGEAARVTLYAATAYYGDGYNFELSNNPSDSTGKKTMGTLKTLLEWNTKYAPTAMERQINDYLCSNGYGRNPFVDDPSFASNIWDVNGIRA
jgi:hypothetical protein